MGPPHLLFFLGSDVFMWEDQGGGKGKSEEMRRGWVWKYSFKYIWKGRGWSAGTERKQVSFGIHQGEEVKASIKANLDRKRQ